jgi:hypothetical protein
MLIREPSYCNCVLQTQTRSKAIYDMVPYLALMLFWLLQLCCFQAVWILTFLKAYLDLVSPLGNWIVFVLFPYLSSEYSVDFYAFVQWVVSWLSSLCMKCCLLHLTIVARSKLSKLSLWAWPACLQGLSILQIKQRDSLSKHFVLMTSMDLLSLSARDSYVAFYNFCTAAWEHQLVKILTVVFYFSHKSQACFHGLWY